MALAVAALTVAGVMVGVEFCVAFFVNPILDRLPGNGGLAGRADGGRVLGRVMPVWYIASLILTLALAVNHYREPGMSALIGGVALFVLSVVMSIAVLVPINNRSKNWTPKQAPDDWREQHARWDRYHYARVAVIITAFVLVAIGVIQSS
ncbi:membrane protein [Amorphoplanes nipponensis]|uniref:Membrane protein n=2 Tax=Actinoplanes nipponensis TaxID=135950 RepID=A0A919JM14_9ACTN|nr:membrane protein [Actinoplanes nipponensis]